jgi:hypothetical protein
MTALLKAKQFLLENYYNTNKEKDNWSPYKTFVHCAQTIDYSIKGYPKNKPVIIQKTIGKLVLKKFLKQGFMKHSLTAPVPGAPDIGEDGSSNDGLNILIKSIDQFEKYNGSLSKHLIFGEMTKEEYSMYFAMHIYNHLEEFR